MENWKKIVLHEWTSRHVWPCNNWTFSFFTGMFWIWSSIQTFWPLTDPHGSSFTHYAITRMKQTAKYFHYKINKQHSSSIAKPFLARGVGEDDVRPLFQRSLMSSSLRPTVARRKESKAMQTRWNYKIDFTLEIGKRKKSILNFNFIFWLIWDA